MPICFSLTKVASPTPENLFTDSVAKKSFSIPGCTNKKPLGLDSSVAILAIILLVAKPNEIGNLVSSIICCRNFFVHSNTSKNLSIPVKSI